MLVAILTSYRASRKEPLAEMLERIHKAFLDAGLSDPAVSFSFGDAPVPGFTSAVERAVRKFPKLEPFLCSRAPAPSSIETAQLSNFPATPAAGRELDLFTLLAVARGVPRSLPFHNVVVQFHHPEFGQPLPPNALAPLKTPGILAGDSWWINGRNRSLASLTVVEAGADSKKLPAPAGPVAAILAACGKASESTQLPLPSLDSAATPAQAAQAAPDVQRRVAELVYDYRKRLAEIVEQARMPHELPPPGEALQTTPLGLGSGPKKPALALAFQPLGYNCRGGSGVFTLRRKSGANLSVEVSLDVGTWSNSLTAFYEVHGVGFTARLPLPPARSAIGVLQYQIGGPDRWNRIVENLAALVSELDRTFVPALETAAGPTPAWFDPRR